VFTFDECARVIVQIIDALGIDRVHMVGNSWGGMIGGTFAATYPDRVGVSVLMNATASPAGLRQKVEFPALSWAAVLLGGIRGPLVKPVLDAFLGPTALREKPSVVAAVNESVRRVVISSGRRAVSSVVPRRPDQRELFGRIRTPVLVVAGSEDATFPVAEARVMAAAIPGSRFVVLDKAAHLAALECPDEVNTLIEEFVAAHS
jgi:3-oxoadipate enol-lactonase